MADTDPGRGEPDPHAERLKEQYRDPDPGSSDPSSQPGPPQPPTGNQPQGWPQQPPPMLPHRKSRRARNVLLGIAGAIVLIVVIAAVASSGNKPNGNAGTSAASNVQQPATQPTVRPSSPPSPAATAPSSPQTLMTFRGSGIDNSVPFNVGDGPLTIQYSFDCSSFGGAGNFIANLLYGKQGSRYSDDELIANDLAPSASETTTVDPVYPGLDYYLSVNSECHWSITVVGS